MVPFIAWRARWLMLYAGVRTFLTGQHVYLSTGCLAGEHDYCKSMIGTAGQKHGGMSKFSNAPCICRCHHP